MAGSQMTAYAPSPAAAKREIHGAPDRGTGQRNQPRSPLFRGLDSYANRQTLRDFRNQPLQNLFFRQIFAEIDALRGGGAFPHLNAFTASGGITTVQQREPLDEPQGDEG